MSRPVALIGLPALLLLSTGCHLIFSFEHDDPSPDQALVQDAGGDRAADVTPPDAPGPDRPSDVVAPAEAVLPPDAASFDAPQPDLGLGLPCSNDSECATKSCVKGICCDSACASSCSACDLTGKLGTCSPLPSGTKCPSTCSGNTVDNRACNGAGLCQVTSLSSCGNYLCKAGDCLVGCKTHADCHPGSLSSGLCDRRKAHVSGQGVCLDPKLVVEATPGGGISGAVTLALTTGGKSAVLVPKATYQEQVVLGAGKSIFIAGDESTISSPNSASPAVMVIGGDLALQGLVLTHTATGTGDGAACIGGTLRVVDSWLQDNSGAGAVVSADCTFELRRSRVFRNDAGGLDLSGGKYGNSSTVVNNVIAENGTAGSSGSQIGGISLTWQGLPLPTLYNNTIASNVTTTGNKAGVICNTALIPGQSYKLINTVVWFNSPGDATLGCAFEYSIMKGLVTGMGNLNANPNLDASYRPIAPSPCIDQGTTTAGVTVLDLANDPRPKVSGGKVDKGAFEVQ